MNTLSILAGYGSLELKRAYRKNTAFGIIAASVLFLAAAVIISILTQVKPSEAIKTIIIKNTSEILRGPVLSQPDIPINFAPQTRVMPSTGDIVPVADSMANDNVEVATQDQLSELVAQMPISSIDDISGNQIIVIDTNQLLPEPGQFIPRDEEPVPIEIVQPVYPPMAMRASITGKVWVNVLIDKEGKIRDVKILKGSGANAGFEEAAIEAAWKTTWKPAFSNGLPVAVWLQYSIDFILK